MASLNKSFGFTIVAAVMVAIVVVSEIGAQEQQYCAYNQSHSMCLYPSRSNSCLITSSGVNTTAQNLIVYLHNNYRSRIAAGSESRGNPGPQPGASDMNALIWDDELARIAQRWTDQALLNSDAVRDIPNRYGYVGQNMYAYVDSANTVLPPGPNTEATYWQFIVDRWFSEARFFPASRVNSYAYDPNNGHYTQAAWGNTTAVGCGYTQYASPNNRFTRLHACNYGPGGNYAGRPVYTTGLSCTACAQGRSCQSYLCAQNGTTTTNQQG